MFSRSANQGDDQPGGAPPAATEAGGPQPAERQQPVLDTTAQQAPQAARLSSSFMEKAFPSFFKVKPTEVVVFSRQLATLIDTGIPLLSALELLVQQVGTSRMFKAVLQQISNDLSTGFSFAQAVNMHPTVFSEIYRRTLTVGERTGKHHDFRRFDLGVEPFMAASALVGVVAQRMVRRLCAQCTRSRPAIAEEKLAYETRPGNRPSPHRGSPAENRTRLSGLKDRRPANRRQGQ